jgi:hypothetical protein
MKERNEGEGEKRELEKGEEDGRRKLKYYYADIN